MTIYVGLTTAMMTLATFGLAALQGQGNPAPARGTLSQLQWLAGVWLGGAGPVTFEERWSPAAGGAMLATSRTVKGDRMVSFEFLRIVERDGGMVYIAQPN